MGLACAGPVTRAVTLGTDDWRPLGTRDTRLDTELRKAVAALKEEVAPFEIGTTRQVQKRFDLQKELAQRLVDAPYRVYRLVYRLDTRQLDAIKVWQLGV